MSGLSGNPNDENENASGTSWAGTSCKVRYGNTDCENQSGEGAQAWPKRHLGLGMPGSCDWTEGPKYGIVLKDVIGGGTEGAGCLDQ